MVKQTERVDVPVDQIEAAGRADLERNTAALESECDTLRAEGIAAAVRRKGVRQQAEGRCRRGRPRRTGQQRTSSSRTMWPRFRSSDEALVAEAPPTTAPMPRSFKSLDRMITAWRRSITSRRRIRSGARPSKQPTFPARRRCFTTVHEVWPTFLQFLHSNADPSKLEGIWVGYAFAEGWAPRRRNDVGKGSQGRSRETHWSTHGCCCAMRLLSSIGLHTHGMTVAQPEKMFRSKRSKTRATRASRRRAAPMTRLSELHLGQTHDPQTSNRLDRQACRQGRCGERRRPNTVA